MLHCTPSYSNSSQFAAQHEPHCATPAEQMSRLTTLRLAPYYFHSRDYALGSIEGAAACTLFVPWSAEGPAPPVSAPTEVMALAR